jgi:hypothetical protein
MIRRALIAVLLLGLVSPALLQADEAAGEAEKQHIRLHQTPETTTLVVTGRDADLQWNELLRGLARLNRFDDGALAGYLPSGTIDLHSRRAGVALTAVDAAMGGYIDLAVRKDANGAPALHITVDRAARRQTKRRIKAGLRDAAGSLRRSLGYETPGADRGLKLRDGWRQTPPAKPIVLFVHGLNPAGKGRDRWLARLHDRDYPTGRFTYLHEGPLRQAANRLHDALERLGRDHPRRDVVLLTFSMGGLVGRGALEFPEQPPENVTRLIMIAPPNHGSNLAPCSVLLEAKTYAHRVRDGEPVGGLFHAIEDGLGEAANDLRPGSIFLRKLNRQRRAEDIAYTIILGTGGPLPAGPLRSIRQELAHASEESRVVQFFRPRLENWLDLDEVVRGRGDGAVAVKRGRLAGVEDVVTLPFAHEAVLDPEASSSEPFVMEVIRDRLSASPIQP